MNNTSIIGDSDETSNCTVQESVILGHYCSGALQMDRIVTPIWYIIGITGNLVSTKIWLERRMRRNNPSAIYLATLSINDTLFLVLHMLQELKYAWFQRTVDYPVVCGAYAIIYLATNYLAPTLVLGFTVERFIAVCYPYQKLKYCTSERAWKVVVGLVCLCLALAGIQPYFWEYVPAEEKCQLREAQMKFWVNWSWATEMLIFLFVPIVILVLNILVMLEIRKMSGPAPASNKSTPFGTRLRQSITRCHRQNHNHHTGNSQSSSNDARRRDVMPAGQQPQNAAATNALLLSVSFYVICSTLPATIVYVLASAYPEGDCHVELEEMGRDPKWSKYFVYFVVRKVVDELCLSHYACNFFLYTITGKMFRQSLAAICRCCVNSGGYGSDPSTKYYTVNRTEDGVDQSLVRPTAKL